MATVRHSTKPVVSARDLTKVYSAQSKAVRALDAVNIQAFPGEVVAVLGAQGAGKSTLLRILAGADLPTSGTVVPGRNDVSKPKKSFFARNRRVGLGLISDDFGLVPTLAIRDNILLPAKIAKIKISEVQFQDAVRSLALGNVLDRRPADVSPSHRQLVSCCRAMVGIPRLLIADEPTEALDSTQTDRVLRAFRGLAHQHGVTVIIATSNPAVADQADRIVVLDGGWIQGDAAPEIIATEPKSVAEPVDQAPQIPVIPVETVSTATGMIPALSKEQVEVIDKAQQILDSLPGSVAPDLNWDPEVIADDTTELV